MEQLSRHPGDHYPLDLRDPGALKRGILQTLTTVVGRDPLYASGRDWYYALAYLLRGVLGQKQAMVGRQCHESGGKRLYYLSLEYLPGKFLPKVLSDLGIEQQVADALKDLGQSLEEVSKFEVDTALGNGGLGRLAACFLDSLATHNYPGFGYGIRYEFGMFSQSIEDGHQVERPEHWLRFGDPWQYERAAIAYTIRFNGRLVRTTDLQGVEKVDWVGTDDLMAVAHDLPMSGYRSDTVLYLRLWAARSSHAFDLKYFNEGNYVEAVRDKTLSESISKVLYPNDNTSMGQELRLKQEYFFVSASLQDILRRHFKSNPSLDNLSDQIAIQLNDTHPSLAIPELMRLLIDDYKHTWNQAWEKVSGIFGYTNHTLLPEALETWPIAMLEKLLPRHLDIIYRINDQHLKRVAAVFPGELHRLGQLSLVDDFTRRIRMAHLAIVGAHKVNGVSELQTRLLRETVFPGFAALDPGKILPITNGITPRQWLVSANPQLARLITEAIGAEWPTQLEQLSKLTPKAEDAGFRAEFRRIKGDNKVRLAQLIQRSVGQRVDPDSLFDVQVKRIHEYKRQLLNLMHVITRYNRIKAGKGDGLPRTVIIGGKAAPGYYMAKHIIRLINDVAATINADPQVAGALKLVFVPNYRVSVAEIIIPGADLAQHISTAGTEASGTSNMKFAINGALTLGTDDGANIEIRKAVGEDHMFLFGLSTQEVAELRAKGYNPWAYQERDPELQQCLDMIGGGFFSPHERTRYQGLRDSLLSGGDHYLLLADYRSYVDTHDRVDSAFQNAEEWTRSAVLNVAHMGRFSADRAIHEYAEKIWNLTPLTQSFARASAA
jgi:starch phosphorylase